MTRPGRAPASRGGVANAAANGAAPAITRDAIAATRSLIAPHVRATPVITIDRAELGLPGGPLTLKLEQLQHSGSFKARGAFANLLLREVPPAGVAAASGGNHGAAVAFAARALGVPARVFVPEVSSPAKTARIRAYGAELVVQGATYSDALEVSERWLARSGALAIHAYDQPETILGAGTTGLELAEQVPGVAAVLAAIGGGGLLSGVATALAGQARIIGVEPDCAPTMTAALAAGAPADAPAGSVCVDSLAPRRMGTLTFGILSRLADSVLLVTDDEIEHAQRTLWDRLRVIAEPGGSAALAALLAGRYVPAAAEHVAVIISGGNTTAVELGPG